MNCPRWVCPDSCRETPAASAVSVAALAPGFAARAPELDAVEREVDGGAEAGTIHGVHEALAVHLDVLDVLHRGAPSRQPRAAPIRSG